MAAHLIDAGLHGYVSPLTEQAQPALRMGALASTEGRQAGPTSSLGGRPNLPVGFEWPQFENTPLSFIGQINLGELKGFAAADVLPPGGILSFFYHSDQMKWGFDPNDYGSARVFWFPEARHLEPTDGPKELPEHGVFDRRTVSFHEFISLPPYQAREIEALGFSDEDADKYFNAWEAWNQLQGDGPAHQLLGHPSPIQDEMQLECQLVTNGIYCGGPEGYSDPRRKTLESGVGAWRLLAQVDSDDDLGMMWGDVGMLYYWIKEEDLKNRQFDRVWMILQCS